MPPTEQVFRFAVGAPNTTRSRSWRLWVPKGKSDVYIASRRLGSSIKVSLHEPGPSRYAFTREWVRRTGYTAPIGADKRRAFEWERPRPTPPNKVARPFTIIVPWDEVRQRETTETGKIVWITPPAQGMAVHFDIVYIPAGAIVSGHPGQRSMGTTLVGDLKLANGERVFITALARPIPESLLAQINKLRNAKILDVNGNSIVKNGMLAFGTEPNPDADDGTHVGILVDVTR